MKKLTDVYLRSLKPTTKRSKSQRDDGLYVVVMPNGSKLWRYGYSFCGKETSLSLGSYPDVPLAVARKQRDEARRLVAAGINPSLQRREARAAAVAAVEHSFSAVVERWKTDELAQCSAEYQRNVTKMLDRDVLPYIGAQPVAEIKPRELIVVVAADRALISVGGFYQPRIDRRLSHWVVEAKRLSCPLADQTGSRQPGQRSTGSNTPARSCA